MDGVAQHEEHLVPSLQTAHWAIIDLISIIAQYQIVKIFVRAEDLSNTRHPLPVEWDMILVCVSYLGWEIRLEFSGTPRLF